MPVKSKVVKPVPEQDKLQFEVHERKMAEIKEKDIFEKDHSANYLKNQKKLNDSFIKKGFKVLSKEEEAKVKRNDHRTKK